MATTREVRLLVLGGTEFVGRAIVEEAVARGWTVTVLNRGTHDAPDGVKALRGDRTGPDGLAALDGAEWDVVVDTWSWDPAAVQRAAEALADRASHYAYVSSRSVYVHPAPAGAAEDSPTVPADPAADDYAAMKATAEQFLQDVFGDRGLLARAGLILGPYENVGRLPWWLDRIARGGDVLAPLPAELPLQYIDVRDLASWLLTAAADGLSGPYNVVSPPGHATMRSFLEACVEATGSDATLVWVETDTLADAGVEPWTDLPIWIPPGELHDALHRADVSAALAAGLSCRPVGETVRDTWQWLQRAGGATRREDRPPVGIDPATEAEILARIRA